MQSRRVRHDNGQAERCRPGRPGVRSSLAYHGEIMRRLLLLFTCVLCAQNFDPKHFAGMRWRDIGPFRGGRTVGAAGIANRPTVFYIGVNNGGVWKTDDYGRTWKPIFDDQPTGSIGALAIAPSNPNIIYV